MKFGQTYHTENLFWSGAKVLNSCTQRLRDKIEETAQTFSSAHKTGPVYFVLLYKLVLSSTPVSMRAVVSRLEKLKLTDFEGENVKNAVSLVRGAVGLLENNRAVPSDMVNIAFRIMRTSSTIEFNTHVNTMRTNHELNVKKVTLDELLLNLQNKYTELTFNNEWEVGTSTIDQQSVFVSSYECHSCGSTDHFWRDCPHLDIDKVAEKLKSMGVRGSGRGSGRGTGRGFRRGGGKGNSGRGAGGTSNVFRTPPKAGQSHVRQRGPLTERWCGTCGVWGAHATQQHEQAATAQMVATDEQSYVSGLTSQQPDADNKPTSSTEDEQNSQGQPSDASVPTLLLNFI